MWHDYFEQLDRRDRRRAEHRRLDDALQAATREQHDIFAGTRVALGRTMIRLGARIAGESVQPAGRTIS